MTRSQLELFGIWGHLNCDLLPVIQINYLPLGGRGWGLLHWVGQLSQAYKAHVQPHHSCPSRAVTHLSYGSNLCRKGSASQVIIVFVQALHFCEVRALASSCGWDEVAGTGRTPTRRFLTSSVFPVNLVECGLFSCDERWRVVVTSRGYSKAPYRKS